MNWYYASENGTQIGPIPEQSLRALLANGTLKPDTPVRREDKVAWISACKLWPADDNEATWLVEPSLATVKTISACLNILGLIICVLTLFGGVFAGGPVGSVVVIAAVFVVGIAYMFNALVVKMYKQNILLEHLLAELQRRSNDIPASVTGAGRSWNGKMRP